MHERGRSRLQRGECWDDLRVLRSSEPLLGGCRANSQFQFSCWVWLDAVRDKKSAVTVLRVLHGDAENRLVRSFRPRRRKLGPELTRVYDRLRSTWSVAEHGSVLDLSAVFANDNPVCLEIGCGRGDLAIAFAPSHLTSISSPLIFTLVASPISCKRLKISRL